MEPIRIIDIDGGKFYTQLQEEFNKASQAIIEGKKTVPVKVVLKLIPDTEDDYKIKILYSCEAQIPAQAGFAVATIVDGELCTESQLSKEAEQLALNFTGEEPKPIMSLAK